MDILLRIDPGWYITIVVATIIFFLLKYDDGEDDGEWTQTSKHGLDMKREWDKEHEDSDK